MKKLFTIIALMAIFQGCGGGGGGSNGGSGNPVPTPTPTPTPEPPGSEDTVVIGEPGLCSAGDVARVDVDAQGATRFALINDDVTCDTSKDNRKEEYTLIVYNTTASAMSFAMNSPLSETPISTSKAIQNGKTQLLKDFVEPKAPSSSGLRPVGRNQMAKIADEMVAYGKPKKYAYGKSKYRRAMKSRALSVNDEVEFRVRNSPSDKDSFVTTSAILRAQGTRINIFLDRDAPFGPGNADSLTSAQLNSVADIFDDNIYPLVVGLLGSPSDVDDDDKINVVITPVLNRDVLCSTAEGYAHSYFDPRNLLPYHPVSNPLSNESETIFVFAPDSLHNYSTTEDGDNFPAAAYLNYLNAWLAFQLTHLVSYNQHVLETDQGISEDDWIDDGLGAVMADLAGFNIWRHRAKIFHLDHPQVRDLREETQFDCDAKANYLFMLYYTYSQLNSTVRDSNSDGFDDDLDFLANLMTSGKTGEANLQDAVEFSFEEDVESEFQAIFKDWLIAIATSGSQRTDLQQSGQTAVKYYYNLNPTVLGSGIGNASGSVRTGAVGNDIGIDMNGFNTIPIDYAPYTLDMLVENADEHVYSPGNIFQGYIAPYSAMFVRVSGMFQSKQTISFKGSSGSIKGFIVRRSDLTYPKTYNESIFSSIDQHFEDLDAAGPNPYWTGQGIAKRVDLSALVASAPVSGTSKEFISILGEIDKSNQIKVCPKDTDDCAFTDVPDTDKYIFTVPDLSRGDEGSLELVVRRYHDSGSENSSYQPFLAVVSSKDVPYPYVPHPIRNRLNGLNTTDTRQPYRWLTSKLICGDAQTDLETNVGTEDCTPRQDDDSSKILFEESTLVENTGLLETYAGTWDGNIEGGECDVESNALGADDSGYGDFSSYPVESVETSGSPLGRYPWSQSFMTLSYSNGVYPDILFKREFLTNTTSYPEVIGSSGESPEYDPRSINGLTLNCHQITSGTDPDTTNDSPDDFLEAEEIYTPSSLPEQILAEMARYRFSSAGLAESFAAGTLDAQYDDDDTLAIDGDSRDDIPCFSDYDIVNNMNTVTVKTGEGALVAAGATDSEPHIAFNLNRSGLKGLSQPDQDVYRSSGETTLKLSPGKNYTVIVGGVGGAVGSYELRIRKVGTPVISTKCSQ